jgi:hypothetical protein
MHGSRYGRYGRRKSRRNDKKKDDAKKLQSLQLTERDVDYIKTPLVYETTGGFGKEAKTWFKKVQLEFRKIHPRDRWSCPPWRPGLIAGGNATTRSPFEPTK